MKRSSPFILISILVSEHFAKIEASTRTNPRPPQRSTMRQDLDNQELAEEGHKIHKKSHISAMSIKERTKKRRI
jgi:hypothetical protein